MAEIPMVMSEDPQEMLSLGRRHLAVRDYTSAVTSLGKACELLAMKHGQTADECGEAYLWYGKSLLGLAREESGVLGDGIPQGAEEDEDGEDDGEQEGETGEDEKKMECVEESAESGIDSEKNDSGELMDENPPSKETGEPSSSTAEGPSSSENGPSSSSGAGPSSSNEAGPSTIDEDEDEEDEIENLQLAWEIFELARDIFIKRGDKGKKELADVYLNLGNVSLESETYDKAVSDMEKSLQLHKDLYSSDDRRIAEIHYQIGLAHSLSNGFSEAIENFQKAADILQARIKNLENPAAGDANIKKHQASDSFYSVEGEIKELKELLPEIKEKIQDMHDYKAETLRSVRETLGLDQNGSSKKEAAPSSTEKGEEKKVSDISHLVKRKRKASEEEKTEESTPKKSAT